MSVKRIFYNFLIGLILVLGIGAVSTSGFTAAEANTANADLSPQVGIMAVIANPNTGLTTTEGGDTATFNVHLDTDPGGPVTVTLTSSNTAEGTVSPATMDFDETNYLTDQTATVTGVDDAVDDGDQAYTIDLTSTEGNTSVAVSNTDDDPTVSFTTDVQSEAEDVGTMTITAQLSVDATSDVTVPYTLSGTATDVDDYSIAPNPLVITAGDLTDDITITVVDDALDEDDEDVVVTMGTLVNADPGTTTVHTATITDDDPLPTVTFTTDAQAGAENIGTLTVTAELSEVSGRDVTLPYILSGSATDVDDYSITPASPLVIPAGSLSADLTITVVDDADDEGSEDVVITMDPPINAVQGATTIHTATIVDIPTVSFTTDSQQEAESIGSMTITAELSAVSGLEVTVPYTLSGNADNTSDFTIAPPPPLSIPAGELSTDITITVIDDLIDENNETVIVEIDSPVNADPGAITEHTATITDDDTAGITVLDPGTLSPPVELLTSEDGLSDTFTVELDTQPEYDVSIALSSNNESEGTVDKSSLTFTEATWNVPQPVTITGVDDDIADEDIVFNIILDPATSTDNDYNGLDPDDVVVRNSDDETPGYTVAPVDGLWTTEGMLSTIINVKLKSKPKDTVTLDISSTNTDEGTVSPTQIIVQPDDWKTAIEIQVTGVDDTVVDGDKPYQVVIKTTSADDKYNDETFTRDIINYDAPTIEWDLPVEDGGVYEVDNLVPIQIRVKKIGDEPISKVRFYRWSVSLQDHVTIGEVSEPPYELFLDPANLEDGFNQIFAFAFGPEPVDSDDMQTFSKHKLIYIFRRADMVYRVYSPLISNQ